MDTVRVRTLTVGVDPGKDGAIVVLEDGRRVVQKLVMPMIVPRRGATSGRARREYDDNRILNFLRRMAREDAIVRGVYEVTQPRTAGKLSIREHHTLAAEMVDLFKRAKDILPHARRAFLHSALIEKVKRIESRCTGGRQGVLSAAAQAEGITIWRVAFKAMLIPAEPIYPATWQRVLAGFSGADPKARALRAAQSFFPDVDFRASERARVPHKGMVDAALIALVGAQRFGYSISEPETRRDSPAVADGQERSDGGVT